MFHRSSITSPSSLSSTWTYGTPNSTKRNTVFWTPSPTSNKRGSILDMVNCKSPDPLVDKEDALSLKSIQKPHRDSRFRESEINRARLSSPESKKKEGEKQSSIANESTIPFWATFHTDSLQDGKQTSNRRPTKLTRIASFTSSNTETTTHVKKKKKRKHCRGCMCKKWNTYNIENEQNAELEDEEEDEEELFGVEESEKEHANEWKDEQDTIESGGFRLTEKGLEALAAIARDEDEEREEKQRMADLVTVGLLNDLKEEEDEEEHVYNDSSQIVDSMDRIIDSIAFGVTASKDPFAEELSDKASGSLLLSNSQLSLSEFEDLESVSTVSPTKNRDSRRKERSRTRSDSLSQSRSRSRSRSVSKKHKNRRSSRIRRSSKLRNDSDSYSNSEYAGTEPRTTSKSVSGDQTTDSNIMPLISLAKLRALRDTLQSVCRMRHVVFAEYLVENAAEGDDVNETSSIDNIQREQDDEQGDRGFNMDDNLGEMGVQKLENHLSKYDYGKVRSAAITIQCIIRRYLSIKRIDRLRLLSLKAHTQSDFVKKLEKLSSSRYALGKIDKISLLDPSVPLFIEKIIDELVWETTRFVRDLSRDWWKASAHRAQLRRQRDIDILEKRRSHANFVTSSTQTVEDWPKVTVVQQISPVQSFNKEAREWMKVSHALASTLGHCTNVVREYVAIRDPYRNSESMNKMRVEGLISRIVPSFVPDNIWGLPQRPQTSLPKPLKMSDMQTLFCEIFDPSTDDSQENTQAQQKDSTENQTGVFANVNESNLKSKDESREGQENSEFVQSPSDSSQLWVVQSLVGGQMCRIALEQLLWYSEQRKAGITDKSIQCSAVVANSSVQTDEISQEKPQSCDVEIQTDPPERVKRRLAKAPPPSNNQLVTSALLTITTLPESEESTPHGTRGPKTIDFDPTTYVAWRSLPKKFKLIATSLDPNLDSRILGLIPSLTEMDLLIGRWIASKNHHIEPAWIKEHGRSSIDTSHLKKEDSARRASNHPLHFENEMIGVWEKFFYEWAFHRYGLKSLTDQHISSFFATLLSIANTHPRSQTFLRFSGCFDDVPEDAVFFYFSLHNCIRELHEMGSLLEMPDTSRWISLNHAQVLLETVKSTIYEPIWNCFGLSHSFEEKITSKMKILTLSPLEQHKLLKVVAQTAPEVIASQLQLPFSSTLRVSQIHGMTRNVWDYDWLAYRQGLEKTIASFSTKSDVKITDKRVKSSTWKLRATENDLDPHITHDSRISVDWMLNLLLHVYMETRFVIEDILYRAIREWQEEKEKRLAKSMGKHLVQEESEEGEEEEGEEGEGEDKNGGKQSSKQKPKKQSWENQVIYMDVDETERMLHKCIEILPQVLIANQPITYAQIRALLDRAYKRQIYVLQLESLEVCHTPDHAEAVAKAIADMKNTTTNLSSRANAVRDKAGLSLSSQMLDYPVSPRVWVDTLFVDAVLSLWQPESSRKLTSRFDSGLIELQKQLGMDRQAEKLPMGTQDSLHILVDGMDSRDINRASPSYLKRQYDTLLRASADPDFVQLNSPVPRSAEKSFMVIQPTSPPLLNRPPTASLTTPLQFERGSPLFATAPLPNRSHISVSPISTHYEKIERPNSSTEFPLKSRSQLQSSSRKLPTAFSSRPTLSARKHEPKAQMKLLPLSRPQSSPIQPKSTKSLWN